MRVPNGVAHLARIADFLAADVENDVAGPEPMIGGDPVGIDIGDDHALVAAAGNLPGWRQRQTKARDVSPGRLAAGPGFRPGLALVRQQAEGQRDRFLGTLVQDGQLHGSAGRQAADMAGKLAGVPDHGAIHRGNHVAGFDAGLGGRAARLRLGHQRALHALETEAVGNLGRDRLDLHADPAACDRALVLELSHDLLHGVGRDRKGYSHRAAGG